MPDQAIETDLWNQRELVPKGTPVLWCITHRKFYLVQHKPHPLCMRSVVAYNTWLEVG